MLWGIDVYMFLNMLANQCFVFVHMCCVLANLGLKSEFWRSKSTWGLMLDLTGIILITSKHFLLCRKLYKNTSVEQVPPLSVHF